MRLEEADNKINEKEVSILFHKKIYLYGAGKNGKKLCKSLEHYDCFGGFIDGSLEKQKSGYMGRVVLSAEQYIENRAESIIVITASKINTKQIQCKLQDMGLKHRVDFWLGDEFTNYYLPMLAYYFYDSCFVPMAQIVLTERCTLKCEKCAHACYAVDQNAIDMEFGDVCKSADLFFGKVDYIQEFVLIGGEPLLYKQLSQAVQYIGENYRDKINCFCITTNGTLIPSEDFMVQANKHKVYFEVSNYAEAIPRLEKTQKKLMEKLDDNQIDYNLQSLGGYWVDYGFETEYKKWSDLSMIHFFDQCKTPCREMRLNRFYFCVMARSVSDNLQYHTGGGYLDFNRLSEDYKKEILEFNLGYIEQGYLTMCRRCNGFSEQNTKRIPVAVQKKPVLI